jgi:hypothetical protein
MAPTPSQQEEQFIEAVNEVAVELEHDESATGGRAGIRLTLLACDQLAEADLGRDDVALAIVVAGEGLRRYAPDTTAVCARPIASDPAIPGAVRRPVRALAKRVRLVAADTARPSAERLAWDAAAGQLDREAAMLP